MRALLFLAAAAALLGMTTGLSRAGEPSVKPVDAPCVDVQIGNEHAADIACINQRLRIFSSRQQAVPTVAAPIDSRASSPAIGIANVGAARQMMGNAFGKSAVPQRPHPVFVSPLTGAPAAR